MELGRQPQALPRAFTHMTCVSRLQGQMRPACNDSGRDDRSVRYCVTPPDLPQYGSGRDYMTI